VECGGCDTALAFTRKSQSGVAAAALQRTCVPNRALDNTFVQLLAKHHLLGSLPISPKRYPRRVRARSHIS
jgi:hypothetical protein